jgi:hypothetical protein
MANSSLMLLCYILGTAITVVVIQTTRTWLRLRHIPGPFSAGFFSWWELKHTLGGRMHLDTTEVCEKYGKTYNP